MKRNKATPISEKSNTAFFEKARYCAHAEQKNLFLFSLGLFRNSRFYQIWERSARYMRRFRMVSTAFRIFPWILLLISTNTLLYAVAAMLLFLLPFVLLTLLSLVASALIRYKKINQRMQSLLSDQTVYVLFPERSREFSFGSFWRGNAIDLAKRENAFVLIVSPFFLSPRGLLHHSFYYNVRMEKNNIFLVRRHYFFSLKKHVLESRNQPSIFIY